MYFIFLLAFFLVTFSSCFPFYSVYAFLTLVCKKGKTKEVPRKQRKGKGRKHRAKERLVLGREEVRMRPECGVQVSKLEETTNQH